MKEIIILGAGSNALNVIDLLLNEQKDFIPIGILDPKSKGDVMGIPIIGTDKILNKLVKKDSIKYAFPAIGFGKNVDNLLRKKIYEKIKKNKLIIPNLISSRAFIRTGVKMGEGNLIQAGSIIDTNVKLGSNINIGLNVAIGHNSIIKSHVTISGTVNINGNIIIGEGTFLGMSCAVYKNIGSWCKIAPGVALLEKIPSNKVVYGNKYNMFPNIINK